MNPAVLLVSTATRWLGTARMPRTLARAGFDVALLAPRDSLALKSRFVSKARSVSDAAIPLEWLLALIQIVDEASPRWLIPCDEMAVRLLFALVLDPPAGLDAAARSRLVTLTTESLGDPRFYAASIDKTLLPGAAEALGVRVPPYTIAGRTEDALAFASARGYPVVLKRRYGFAGEGVVVARSRDELVAAAQRLLWPDALDLGEHRAPRLLVQAFITGPHHSQALVALRGTPLAGFAWERCVGTQEVKGQTAVLRFVASPQSRALTETLCRGFGLSGFFNAQFLIDAGTGQAHLLEINRRIVTHTHLGDRVGADLAAALFRATAGAPAQATPEPATPAPAASAGGDIAGTRIVVFPREWLLDPASRYLRELPVDAPWDDPALFRALVAMRHET